MTMRLMRNRQRMWFTNDRIKWCAMYNFQNSPFVKFCPLKMLDNRLSIASFAPLMLKKNCESFVSALHLKTSHRLRILSRAEFTMVENKTRFNRNYGAHQQRSSGLRRSVATRNPIHLPLLQSSEVRSLSHSNLRPYQYIGKKYVAGHDHISWKNPQLISKSLPLTNWLVLNARLCWNRQLPASIQVPFWWYSAYCYHDVIAINSIPACPNGWI